jgi:hypothetical protein
VAVLCEPMCRTSFFFVITADMIVLLRFYQHCAARHHDPLSDNAHFCLYMGFMIAGLGQF